jgi:hypothetical protein
MNWKTGQEAFRMSDQGIGVDARITGIANLPIESSDKPVTRYGQEAAATFTLLD